MEEDRAGGRTRREVLRRGGRASVVAAAGGTLAALTGLAVGAAPAVALTSDADWLAAALEAERLSVIAYRHVLALPGLPPAMRTVLSGLLVHEQAHIDRLGTDLIAVGGSVPAPPHNLAQVGQTLADHGMNGDLATSRSVRDGLQLLLDVEALTEGAYYRAIGNLSADGPLVHAAQALASEGQHTTLISGMLHPGDITQAVSSWYVAGIS